jgi:diguanylate cyclase (GGDEF)-like protein
LDHYVFSQPIPILVENVDTELTFKISAAPDAPFTYKSFMAAPIPIDANRSAAIKVYGKHSKDFTSAHLRLLQYVAEMLSMLLLNIALYEKTEKLARTDGITGLYVQHYFMEKIQEEIFRAKKHGDTFSLLIIDIDNFKAFNDNYGHQAGDFVLSKTSDFIKGCIRSIDFPCRYGGDEFFIILPGTNAQGARTLAERIRIQICDETHQLEFAGLRIERNITVSIGCGQYHPELGDYKSFISKIDAYLYEAKLQGKNRVVGDTDAQ